MDSKDVDILLATEDTDSVQLISWLGHIEDNESFTFTMSSIPGYHEIIDFCFKMSRIEII